MRQPPIEEVTEAAPTPLVASTGRDRACQRWAPRWLLLAVLVYAALYGGLSIAKHNTFHSHTFDLGILAQTVWNTANGRPFETSIARASNSTLIGSYLGNHVRPILLLIAPLYRLWPDPRLLLVLQSVALALAALPLYWVARRCIGNARLERIVVLCYLAYPALGYANLFDFHPLALSIPLLFLAYWAKLARRMVIFWVAVVLALSTKEELAVPIVAWGAVHIGLALWARWSKRPLSTPAHQGVGTGMALLLVGLAWLGLSLGVIIPHFNDGRPYRFWQWWAQWADVLPGAAAVTAPSRFAVDWPTLLTFVAHLLVPLGYPLLLGPAALVVAVPSMVYLVAAGRPILYTVGVQYAVVLLPWTFLASVEGLAALKARASLTAPHGLTRLLTALYRVAGFSMVLGTLAMQVPFCAPLRYTHAGAFRPGPNQQEIAAAMRQIPPEAGVATINQFGAHLAQRRVLVALESPAPLRLDHLEQVDLILLDVVDCRAVTGDGDQRVEYAATIGAVLATGDFKVQYRAGRIVLLRRGSPAAQEPGCIRLSADGVPQCDGGGACGGSALCQLAADIHTTVEQDWPCWP